MVTDELVQVVLDYPFFVDARAFNTNREGFLRVLAESTALQELLNREDNVDYPKSRRTFVVESKWGSYGLYRHDSYDSPYSYDGPVPYDIKYFS